MSASVLYMRFRKRIAIGKHRPILLGQVAQLIADPELEDRLGRLVLRNPTQRDGNLLLIDMMLVVRKCREELPELQIELFGEPHVLVEIRGKEKPPSLFWVAVVWIVLFIGSGLAIMNFHADVSMLGVHRRIYELVTGRDNPHPLLLQIPYSLGIGMGMVLFFNHLFKKKFNDEPSPLEVEMYLYQENMNHFVITEEYMKMHGKKDAEAHEGTVT
jgi:stage V sporulation protein AA